MKKSIYSEKHQKLRRILASGRKKARLTQQQLADEIGKPQSFVAKYEAGERRLDVIELLEIAKILRLDLRKLLSDLG